MMRGSVYDLLIENSVLCIKWHDLALLSIKRGLASNIYKLSFERFDSLRRDLMSGSDLHPEFSTVLTTVSDW
ncbi:hypothetical protein C5B89_18860 [Haloferax sp. Atlit-47N]|uniref:Uncharacterized protein n=1 Tax=Haloferax gibbonsii (strain ATCC 33959 / DSM 4427 / JCM 8863 / NBRC 102184 / NCIMB 2188 / Ma 2.38) TaxID=1227459 RepID=M0HR63_HALGM|nr:hypothetical protein C454_00540 [Haloferax gibbonsii ATCC 33959]RDZ35764.1 hypothetical protein C5B89_18860 [Haloferax sp. Atlit-47N]